MTTRVYWSVNYKVNGDWRVATHSPLALAVFVSRKEAVSFARKLCEHVKPPVKVMPCRVEMTTYRNLKEAYGLNG